MEIDRAIRIFADFLNKSWDIVTPSLSDRPYTTEEGSKSDWLQSNWELLVERKVMQLNEYLEVYGDGADFNGDSSRITDIASIPTHSVRVLVKNGMDILNNSKIEKSTYTFQQLVGFRNSYYNYSPPFKFALVQDDDRAIERVFLLEQIKFKLQII